MKLTTAGWGIGEEVEPSIESDSTEETGRGAAPGEPFVGTMFTSEEGDATSKVGEILENKKNDLY